MHIPDGYLAPAFSLSMGVGTVPAWILASRRVRAVLDHRSVPLLAIFAAFTFAVMMFNVPVPGGTTAHGVGGTLAAVVLGPSAAIVVVSTALILQALFFGDGGVLAIFANCFNMAVLLPLVGYWTYRLIAGRAPLLSARRAWAAGIGGYVGISAAALATGIELGVQPALFNANGQPLYSPYDLQVAVPAMLVAHLFGAAIVEGLITGLGFAYLQQHHPEYLTSLRTAVLGPAAPIVGHVKRRPVWQLAGGGVLALVVLLFGAGLISGGGDPSHAFGVDWSQVNWADVGAMLLLTLALGTVLVALAWRLLPRHVRGLGTLYTAIAVLTPLGLIAPGAAFGEGSAAEVGHEFGYVPHGLQALNGFFAAPLAGYNVPLPFFSEAGAPLWRQALGYELAGVVGMLALGGLALALGSLLLRRDDNAAPQSAGTAVQSRARSHQPGHADGHVGWLEHTLSGIAGSVEHAVFTEHLARQSGWLQRRDPRAKVLMFLVLVLAASATTALPVLLGLYAGVLIAARASRLPFDYFVKRVWLGIPLFAGIVVLPSIFFPAGPRLFDLALGPMHLGFSWLAVLAAVVFVARVGVCVSLAVLLVVTTPWADLLKSLQALHVPQVFVLVLSMTYRYVFLFLHTLNGLFEARKSRVVARLSGADERRWIIRSMGALMSRSFKMSNDVYMAMMARGFTGEVRGYAAFRMRRADWYSLAGACALAVAALPAGRLLG